MNLVKNGKENCELAVIRILDDIARPKKKISRMTRIYHDLLVSGDDAVELVNRVHDSFGTSFQGFEFGQYFPTEAESLFQRFVILTGGAGKKPMTVEHLINVIESGEWFDVMQEQT